MQTTYPVECAVQLRWNLTLYNEIINTSLKPAGLGDARKVFVIAREWFDHCEFERQCLVRPSVLQFRLLPFLCTIKLLGESQRDYKPAQSNHLSILAPEKTSQFLLVSDLSEKDWVWS